MDSRPPGPGSEKATDAAAPARPEGRCSPSRARSPHVSAPPAVQSLRRTAVEPGDAGAAPFVSAAQGATPASGGRAGPEPRPKQRSAAMTMSELDVLAAVTCSSTRHPGVGRFRRVPGGLELVGVSRQRPGTVLPESAGRAATGDVSMSDGYGGCPSCRADSIVRCGVCSQLGCWDSSWEQFQCPSCGNSGPVRGEISEISSLGGS